MYYRAHADEEGSSLLRVGIQRADHGAPLVARGVVHGGGGEMACDNLEVVDHSFAGEARPVHSAHSYQRMEEEDRN